jgi:hypothetical protein
MTTKEMIIQDLAHRRKGHYLGTEVDENWWKRFKKDKFFARGSGEYWCDDTTFYFRRYLTKDPIAIPFEKVTEVKIGKFHAGKWLLGARVIKMIWIKDGLRLSSGFTVSRNPQESEAFMAELKSRIKTS